MKELEKILEEIKEKGNIQFASYTKPLIAVEDVEKIIRKHMPGKGTDVPTNDGWIPVKERLPEVDEDTEETIEDDDCPEYIVTIRGASESTTLKYSPDGTWFDENGYVYDVIAWRPHPEPYHPERSNEE